MYSKVLLNSFHMNGYTKGFNPITQKQLQSTCTVTHSPGPKIQNQIASFKTKRKSLSSPIFIEILQFSQSRDNISCSKIARVWLRRRRKQLNYSFARKVHVDG